MNPLFTEHCRITSYLMDYHKQLSLAGLLSLIQEAAWEHADRLGYGYAAMQREGLIWALIRQRITVARWPGWGEEVSVRTWLRPPDGLLVTRDLQFSCGAERFCEATAQYLIMHQDSRRPASFAMDRACFLHAERGPHDPERIPALSALPELARFAIRTSDLDMHAHVNNTRIGQWIFDAVPATAHEQQRICGYEVDFQAEMHARESIAVETGPLGDGRWHFQGRREGDGKIVFAARVATLPR